MSGTESSDTAPADKVLEQELRNVVRELVQEGKLEQLTVKRVRLAAEKNLRLAEGFYKSDNWKDRSKAVIESEANATEPASTQAASGKRKSPDVVVPTKRQKKDPTPESKRKTPMKAVAGPKVKTQSGGIRPDSRPEPGLRTDSPYDSDKTRTKKAVKQDSDSELSSVLDDSPKPQKRKKAVSAEVDSSPLSSPIESPPQRMKKKAKKDKSRSRGPSSTQTKSKSQSKSKPSAKTQATADPEAEEIKSLQSWLTKCGIRKVWGKELKPYETPKEKIEHLRSMLADVGMTGRFSIEKAQKIRDMRELQADLEAVQEGAKWWGKSDEDEDRGERRRRISRPFAARRRIVDDDDDDDNDDNDEDRDDNGGKKKADKGSDESKSKSAVASDDEGD